MGRHHHTKLCPQCAEALRLITAVVPVHRWRCDACGWSGLRRDHGKRLLTKRRIVIALLVLMASLIGVSLLWFIDALHYSMQPYDQNQPIQSKP
jgi:hypothetical protein